MHAPDMTRREIMLSKIVSYASFNSSLAQGFDLGSTTLESQSTSQEYGLAEPEVYESMMDIGGGDKRKSEGYHEL